MTPAEAATILTAASVFDNRKPDRETSQAWAGMLGDLNPADCIQAVKSHYSRTTEWLMPAHLMKEVRRIRQDRIDRAGPLDPPKWLDQIADADQFDRAYRQWIGDTRTRIANGEPPEVVAPRRAVTSRPVDALTKALEESMRHHDLTTHHDTQETEATGHE